MRMVTLLGMTAAVVVTGVSAVAQVPAATQVPAPPPAVELKVGDAAPAFSMVGSDGKTHKLSDYRGRAVVLAWFPRAFSGG